MSFGTCCFRKSDDAFCMMTSNKVQIEGFQKGLILNLEVTQTFMNTYEDEAEICYVFPNDMKICIYETTFILGYQIIQPQLIGREEAHQIYQKAVNSGVTAMYGANIAEGLTEFKIGNLPINQECSVILKMAFKANLIDLRTFNFKFPLDVYTPDGSLNCLNYKSNFSMRIQADTEMISSITSNVKNGKYNNDDKTYTIMNEIQNDINENSIILQFKTLENIQSSVMISSKDKNCCVISIANDNLQYQQNEEKLKKEFIFLIDCSGSMKGMSIENAGKCLEIFIRSLPKDALFNVIQFGTRFEKLFKNSIKYDAKSAMIAINLAKSINADFGGTNIYDPLLDIFKTNSICDQRNIFILTDGEVNNRSEVIELVKMNSDKNKCFTIGLGRCCDGGLIEAIADVSGGKSDFVQESDSFSEKVIPQLQCSLTGFINNIEIHCEGENNDSFKVSPYPIPPLCSNKAIQIFVQQQKNAALGKSPYENGVLVTGRYNKETVEILVDKVIQLNDVEEDENGNSNGMNIGKAIIPLYSFELLKKFEQMDSISKKDKMMAIKLSLQSGVLCKYTGYFGMVEPTEESKIKFAQKRGVSANKLMKNKSIYIDGKKYFVVDVSRAKTGKHGHAKVGIDMIDEKTGEKCHKLVSSSEIISTNDTNQNNSFDLISLLAHQNFDGYWENKNVVNEIAGINVDHIEKLKLTDDKLEDKCIATLVAIAALNVLASDQINSWMIIKEKAMKWLKMTLIDVNVDDLLIEIEQLIQNRKSDNKNE